MSKKKGPATANGPGENRNAPNHTPPTDRLQNFLSCFDSVTKSGNGWSARCPAHDDRNPSLSISLTDDACILVKCHAGCTTDAVVDAVGWTIADLFDRRGNRAVTKPEGRPKPGFPSEEAAIAWWLRKPELNGATVTVHKYPNGYRVFRFDFPNGRKTIRPMHWADRVLNIGDPPGKLPLYGRDEIGDAETVHVAEGETCVDAFRSLGLVAVTSAHGSKSASRTDWTPLAGRRVVIHADNDDPGRKHGETVAMILQRLGCQVKIVHLPGLPEGGDIVDFVAAHDSREINDLRGMIEAIVAKTPWLTPPKADPDGCGEAEELRWRPFPIENFPPVIRNFVTEAATAMGCDPAMIAMPALAAITSAIGTTRTIRLKRSWDEHAIGWFGVVAKSGTLKSPAHELAMRPVRRAQQKQFDEYDEALAKYQEAKKAREGTQSRKAARGAVPFESIDEDDPPERPACIRYVVSDVTIEALAPILEANPRGVLCERDEIDGWFAGHNQYKAGKGSDRANWLQLHRAGTITIDRKTGERRTIHVPLAAASLCGTIQPGTLRRALTADQYDSGLSARLLLVMPPTRRKQWTDADLSKQTEDRYADLFARLHVLEHGATDDGKPVPIAVSMSVDAKAQWVSFYNEFAASQSEAGDDLAAAFAKLEGYAARFALVHHFVRWATETGFDAQAIGPESIDFGITLARWFAHETERVYMALGRTETSEQQQRRELIEFIRSRRGLVTARVLQRGGPCFSTAAEARAALDDLVARGIGVWESPKPSAKGGHPTTRFRLVDNSDTDTTRAGDTETTGSVSVRGISTPESESPQPAEPGDNAPPGWIAEAWARACSSEDVGTLVGDPTPSEPDCA